MFARHVLSLGDASSLRAVVNGTARLGQGVRREAESEGSQRQNSDSTNRNRIQGRPCRVTRQWTRMPNGHSEARRVDPARPEGKTQQLNLGDLSFCEDTPAKATTLSAWQHVEMEREKSAAVVVVAGWACHEGPNSLMQGVCRGRLDGCGGAARRILPAIPL